MVSEKKKKTINEVFVRSQSFAELFIIASLSLFFASIYEFTNPDTWSFRLGSWY